MGVCRLRYWCVNIYILFFLIFRYHVKACAPQGVEVTCHPDRMELKFPATAVGGYQEQVVQKKQDFIIKKVFMKTEEFCNELDKSQLIFLTAVLS